MAKTSRFPTAKRLKGYSREADYTRKAQALAQQRQQVEFGLRLQHALDANPALTLQPWPSSTA